MKALVVDDDVVSRMALIDLLSGYKLFDMLEADDGESAWNLLVRGLRPVICFCDVRMPHLSGIELLAQIKATPHLADIPVVLVSSASDRETVLQAVKLGAVGYILKPLQPADARAHLDRIIKGTLDKVAERPEDTLKRLNISAERLSAYLAAFIDQLDAAESDIAREMDAGGFQTVSNRLDTLRSACMTLGLWYMAAQINGMRMGLLDAQLIVDVLAEVKQAVTGQVARLAGSSSRALA